MVARKTDLTKAFLCRLNIAQVFLGNGRKSDDRVHRSPDVVRHGGKEIRLCFICRLRFPCRDLKTLVKEQHVEHVKEEQYQKACRYHSDQQPVLFGNVKIICGNQAQHCPSGCGIHGCKSKNTLFAVRIDHRKRTCRRCDLFG